ncbi:unnamed protein product [Dicrocoelium dendriticum]|nr:unnamed protein product [Dicrocoelium dendriticum]
MDNQEFSPPEVSAYLSTVPEKDVGIFILSFLSDEALRLIRSTGITPKSSSSEIWEALRRLFVKSEPAVIYEEKFATRNQLPGETVDMFSRALRDLALKAFPELSSSARENCVCKRFCMGLRDKSLRNELVRRLPCRLEELLKDARTQEAMEILDSTSESPGIRECHAIGPTTAKIHETTKTTPPTPNPPNTSCWYCHRFGKRAQHCGHNPPIRPRRPRGRSEHLMSAFVCNAVISPLTTVGFLNDAVLRFLIDTGASCSLLRLDVASRLGDRRAFRMKRLRVVTANGSELPVVSSLIARVRLGKITATHEFLVCRNLKWEAILGMDFLGQHASTLYLSSATLTHDPLRNSTGDALSSLHSCPVSLEPSEASPFMSDVIDPLNNDTTLPLRHKMQLCSLLREFEDLFGDDKLGRTSIIQHEIYTGTQHPIRQPARRVPIHYQPQLDNMIKDMLEKHVIRPSTSPWASPIVLVKKKDGSLRLCVDYRRLNEVTRKDSFPLPRIDATFDALHGARWFSTLDLAAGYWQVEVRPSDRGKTAFIVPSGLYEFETMPFGLANAPATFQRLMQKVLEGLVPKECLIYLDDVIVHGSSVEEHNDRLRIVLQRLRQAGLRLKGSKCRFLRSQVTFLGHVITPNGISTDPGKCEKVQSWPRPRNVEDLRSFLGLASYYRRFIRNFATISAPLHRLTEKGRQFLWTDECNRAFTQLKECLSSPPILGLPDVSDTAGPFVLDTDASADAIGAVLSQKTSSGEVVIAYASRRLDKRERRYSTTRRELLALVKFLRYFRPYLIGKPFLVRTDHQSLQWLRNFRDPEGQVARWQEQLQEYEFTCEYRPGARHANADALSRLPASDEVNAVLHDLEVDEAWANDQSDDPYISNIYKRQLDGSSKPSGIEMQSRSAEERALWGHWGSLKAIGRVLYLLDKSGPKLITPTVRIPPVLQKVHNELGHAGQRKTEAAVRQRYWWPGIHADVTKFCNECDICTSVKSPATVPRAPLMPMVTTAPGQRIGVDLMGPLPITANGNRHILVLVDYFTKWCEAVPIKQPDAATVASAFVNEWVARYGAPLSLHSDQGAAFESQLMREVCRLLSIRKTRTTPYHPQGNGLVERTNRTIKGILQTFIERQQTNRWDELLPQCMMAYRAAVHATTGYSPAYLTHGQELRLPVELMSPIPPLEACSLLDYVRDLRERLRSAFLSVQLNMRNAQNRQKQCYDQRCLGPEYHVGDHVWLHRPKPPAGASSKFHRQWQGPYEIVFIRSPTVYVIRSVNEPRSDVLTVHYNQLKPATSSSNSAPSDGIVPPGCLPMVEGTVEIPPEGGMATAADTEALRAVPNAGGGQCNETETVMGL